MIDYTLDQLFVHLDDFNPVIQVHCTNSHPQAIFFSNIISDMLLFVSQEAVFKVISQACLPIDKSLVVKKAELNLNSHRSPVMCQLVLSAAQK
jgi:hypothetical protein